MMLVKSENFLVGFHSQEPRCGTLWAIQVVSSWLRRYDTHIALKYFQLRIVVDVQCQAAFYFFIIPQIQKSFFWFHQDTKQFSQNNGNLPLLQRH
jgi:hypothetical protein